MGYVRWVLISYPTHTHQTHTHHNPHGCSKHLMNTRWTCHMIIPHCLDLPEMIPVATSRVGMDGGGINTVVPTVGKSLNLTIIVIGWYTMSHGAMTLLRSQPCLQSDPVIVHCIASRRDLAIPWKQDVGRFLLLISFFQRKRKSHGGEDSSAPARTSRGERQGDQGCLPGRYHVPRQEKHGTCRNLPLYFLHSLPARISETK